MLFLVFRVKAGVIQYDPGNTIRHEIFQDTTFLEHLATY